MAFEGYFFDEQIAKYQIQFMSIFKGLTVVTGKRADGEIRSLEVPVVYGSKDRVTAAMIAQNVQNSAIKLPTMSAYMTNLSMAPEKYKGVGVTRSHVFLPKGGLFPNDLKTVVQINPVPYMMTMKLSIFTSNMFQHRQILEQILVFFNPSIQIQKSDDIFDSGSITTVELKDINFQEDYPSGEKQRAIVTDLTFDLPIWLAVPADIKNQFIEKIYARISVIETGEGFAEAYSKLDALTDDDIIIDASDIVPVQVGDDCST